MGRPSFLEAQQQIFDILEEIEEENGYETAKDALEAVHRGYDQPLNTYRGEGAGRDD